MATGDLLRADNLCVLLAMPEARACRPASWVWTAPSSSVPVLLAARPGAGSAQGGGCRISLPLYCPTRGRHPPQGPVAVVAWSISSAWRNFLFSATIARSCRRVTSVVPGVSCPASRSTRRPPGRGARQVVGQARRPARSDAACRRRTRRHWLQCWVRTSAAFARAVPTGPGRPKSAAYRRTPSSVRPDQLTQPCGHP